MKMAHFEELLDRYADVVVKIGVNIQEGQDLMITAPISAADFVRRVTKKAYLAGAKNVYFRWGDDDLTLTRYTYAPDESFKEFPQWEADGMTKLAEQGAAFMSFLVPSLDLLKDVDPERIAVQQKVAAKALETYRQYTMSDRVSWTVISVPSEKWAKKVFPNLAPEQAVEKLWEQIFFLTRADQEDPVAAWQKHQEALAEKVAYMNRKAYKKLHYKAPGTDLTIELPEGHAWVGGGGKNEKGIDFMANIPTEEIFTLPVKTGVNGTVSATKPLNYNGNLIENFSFTFKDGKIIDFKAEAGYETLKKLIEIDEGARYLGEVALVPHDSPVSQSGLLFYNALYDENASCHLAIGQAYPCFKDGASLTSEDLEKRGMNKSLVHVDFMVGSDQLDVDGITENGDVEPLLRGGLWVI
jgi:aminopeptidase